MVRWQEIHRLVVARRRLRKPRRADDANEVVERDPVWGDTLQVADAHRERGPVAEPVLREIKAAFAPTQKCLDALATDSGSLKNLPKNVPVLRKGANFADDVADVFVELGIL